MPGTTGLLLWAEAIAAKQSARLDEIAARAVERLAVLLDGDEQLAHRAGEPVVEPGPFKHRARDALGGA